MNKKGDKHHYIPKFYLKHWTGEDKRICEFSRPYKLVVPRRVHPDGTGFKRGLYTVPGLPPETMNLVEDRFLKHTDNAASVALDHLTGNRTFDNVSQRRLDWSRFIFSLMLRFPEAQRSLRIELEETVRRNVAEANEPEGVIKGIEESNDLDKASAKVFLDLLRTSQLTRTLIAMTWEVITIDSSEHSFLTSDRPIINTAQDYGFNEANLAMPISPSQLFVASNSEKVFRALKALRYAALVARTNKLIVTAAVRYVWGQDDSQLRFIEDRMAKHTPAKLPQ